MFYEVEGCDVLHDYSGYTKIVLLKIVLEHGAQFQRFVNVSFDRGVCEQNMPHNVVAVSTWFGAAETGDKFFSERTLGEAGRIPFDDSHMAPITAHGAYCRHVLSPIF